MATTPIDAPWKKRVITRLSPAEQRFLENLAAAGHVNVFVVLEVLGKIARESCGVPTGSERS